MCQLKDKELLFIKPWSLQALQHSRMLIETCWWWTHFLPGENMTKIFIVIFGEEKTWQKLPCASLALKLGSSGVRIHSDSSTSHSARVTCGTVQAVLTRACSQPAKVHLPTLQLLWQGLRQHGYSFSIEKYLGAEEMKLKVLKFRKKEHTFFTSATGLCCTAALSRGQDCAEHTQGCHGPPDPWPPQPSVSCWGLRSAASTAAWLCFFWWSQGRHLSRATVRVIQSDPTAGLCFLSSRHLPNKPVQSLLACDWCQALKHWQCSSLVKYCHPHQPWGEAGLTEHIVISVHIAVL